MQHGKVLGSMIPCSALSAPSFVGSTASAVMCVVAHQCMGLLAVLGGAGRLIVPLFFVLCGVGHPGLSPQPMFKTLLKARGVQLCMVMKADMMLRALKSTTAKVVVWNFANVRDQVFRF